MEFITKPNENLSNVEKWIYYKKIENYAKKEIEKLKKEALTEVESKGGFFTGSIGKAQMINKTNRKPKESLKTFLAEKGILEMCQEDSIDLKKVQEMIDADILQKEEVEKHIELKNSSYVKLV